jgi:hypothetical protein
MQIRGTHMLFYSAAPSADRAFLRDVLGFKYVDTGHDWLIFKLPTAEAGVHPLDGPLLPAGASSDGGLMTASVWLMVDDLAVAKADLAAKGVECGETHEERWGINTSIALPSGARLGLYQPLHPLALDL